ncbi:MAG: acetyl-CoA carboxylase biotin carboxyl carrier protein [Solirubrobacterales bacterium]|nr:acetyl-CoA carboxylase biotin carboxyl carrier protein [Solirubrobacterales bacterium]MBV9715630.1 acetyl-CoA carboxylase biotin carboxyl carrier protein [Solirubrobacterales bacterium]
MSEHAQIHSGPDREMIESVWAEARDLIKRLEGSSVQRLSVAAGEYKIEIERGAPAVVAAAAVDSRAASPIPSGVPVAGGAGPGLGVGPGARMASGVFTLEQGMDNRTPVLAPLVGTFYRASQPGAKAFVEVGDTVEAGQTVCIVEAMKMMNEVVAGESGKVVEIAAENGEWVEFEQVLMYLEPPEA